MKSVSNSHKRRISIRKYPVTEYQQRALKFLLPPEDLSVSQWAEKYRVLDNKSSALPGPWRNEKTPYLSGIMDEFSQSESEEIVFVKPSQVGGTEALLNMLGWVIQQDPSPAMCVYPSDVLAESVVVNRFRPMIYASNELFRRYHASKSSKIELQFDGMYLNMVGSNSPSQLASKPIRYLFLDEIDKYPGASQKEADPIALARERTKTFRNRKIFMTSTPTLRTGHIWRALESCDVIKHYFVPCPHCGKFIELQWKQLKFSQDESLDITARAETAKYVCQECNGIITDRHKAQMLRSGKWQIVQRNNSNPRKMGFWINTLYSPFVRFSEMVREFLSSKNDPENLQNFINSWLAEPWEDTQMKTSTRLLMKRRTELSSGIVPSWAKLLTGGIDVQKDCLYWTIRAWGDFMTSQNIAHGKVSNFTEVERVMNRSWIRQDSDVPMIVSLVLIDSGNDTETVYDFCANNAEWALPCKGSSVSMAANFRVSRVNRATSHAYGMRLVMVDTEKYKDAIAGRMMRENGDGSWMISQDCDIEYADQITSEHKINVRKNGKNRQMWVPKTSHRPNHYLDCEVYAMCAADMLDIRMIHLENPEESVPDLEPRNVSQSVGSEESWLSISDNWLS